MDLHAGRWLQNNKPINVGKVKNGMASWRLLVQFFELAGRTINKSACCRCKFKASRAKIKIWMANKPLPAVGAIQSN